MEGPAEGAFHPVVWKIRFINVITPLDARGRWLSQISQFDATLSSDVTVSQWNSGIVARLHVKGKERIFIHLLE